MLERNHLQINKNDISEVQSFPDTLKRQLRYSKTKKEKRKGDKTKANLPVTIQAHKKYTYRGRSSLREVVPPSAACKRHQYAYVLLVVVAVANVTKSFSSAVHEVRSAASSVHLESEGECGKLRRKTLKMSSHLVWGCARRRVFRRGLVY